MLRGLIRRVVEKLCSSGRVGASDQGHHDSEKMLDSDSPILPLDESFVISHFLQSVINPTILQIGAFDGIANDLWYPWITKNNLNAVLVEPQAGGFSRLRENYREYPSVQCVNCAIAERDECRELFSLDTEGRDLPVWADQLASFNRQVVLSHKAQIPEIESLLTSTPVKCVTFETLFREQDVSQVDALQIDAEGYDKVLLDIFPFDKFLPRLVRFESKHLSLEDLTHCKRSLAEKGYSFFRFNLPRIEEDTLAYRL